MAYKSRIFIFQINYNLLFYFFSMSPKKGAPGILYNARVKFNVKNKMTLIIRKKLKKNTNKEIHY